MSKKEFVLSFRLTEDDFNLLKTWSKNKDQTVSDIIRDMIRNSQVRPPVEVMQMIPYTTNAMAAQFSNIIWHNTVSEGGAQIG